MAKREDADYIKLLSKVDSSVRDWTKLPLVVLEEGTEISRMTMKSAEHAMEQMLDKSTHTIPDMLQKETNIPLDDFLLLNKTVKINNAIERGTMEYNYYRVHKSADKDLLIIEYPTLMDGPFYMLYGTDEGDGSIRFIQGDREFSNESDDNAIGIKRFMTAMFVTVLAFFQELEETNLYPVAVQGRQHRKVHEKKPWTRSDLVTIQFLNVLPREHQPHKGGHHNSPRFHQRRPTKRWLTNERFKNHPKFGQQIPVKGSWVGEREAEYQGTTYKVL